MFSFRGALPPDPLTRGSALDPAAGSAPDPLYIGTSHLYLGGGAPTLTPALRRTCHANILLTLNLS